MNTLLVKQLINRWHNCTPSLALGALKDAGLTKDDVDGYFSAGDAPGLGPLSLVDYMGLKLKHLDATETGGSSYVLHVGHAQKPLQWENVQ